MFAAGTDVSDPYVVATMLRGREKKTMKVLGRTAVLEDKKNPVWNHKVVEEDIDLRKMKTIRLDVRDKDTYTKDAVIGYVDIDIQSLDGKPELTQWYKIHPVKDTMRGSLQVRIRVFNRVMMMRGTKQCGIFACLESQIRKGSFGGTSEFVLHCQNL